MKDLSNITVVAVAVSREYYNIPDPITPMIGALNKTLKVSDGYLKFNSTLILSPYKVQSGNHKLVRINPIKNVRELNYFFAKDFYKYITTDFVLVVQTDGNILNPSKWDDNWLNYDYIGAPWKHHMSKATNTYGIGNGGFSLRSKRICKYVSDNLSKYYYNNNEDGLYSNLRTKPDSYKYPTVEEALHFSQETLIDKTITPFGYHSGRIFKN